ncbi:insulinase family protein [Litorivicinus lipolyticus]|uniref:insulinase family protein n=1 Tax=Litorivicinus lipolyticus TaxID=418701 RepID=UPI001478A6F1|nr:insulinase family protein [Litorivicinus lipolyticus]
MNIVVSPGTDRAYRYVSLDNGLTAVLVSDPNTDKAAASLEVAIGAGSDPRERAGMAHFLEHMLFLGTQPFPQPGEYQQFLTTHGGSSNAYTAYEQTNYHFDVDADQLAPALDRFAAFFVSPLFTDDLVERERNAVHSEYTAKIKEDGRRYFDALKQVVNPEHPFSKFTVGNLDTLSGDNLADEVRQFWTQHYSANLMTLGVVGREPLDSLERMVRERFSAIEDRRLTRQVVLEPMFTEQALGHTLAVQNLRDRRSLTLIFPTREIGTLYRTKPTSYIGSLVGHEGEGSLYSLLRQRGWAEGLSAGQGIANKDGATFMVGIELTPRGAEHRDQIIELVFEHIALIDRRGINHWRHREQGQILATEFRFLSDAPAQRHAMALASALTRYAPEDVMRGPFAWDQYDPDMIDTILGSLTPDNLLLSYSAPDVDGDLNSPWYDTPYSLTPIEPERLSRWTRARGVTQSFSTDLPSANPFVASAFDLESQSGHAGDTPDLLIQADNHQHWHLQDRQFLKPRADIYLRLATPAANATAQQSVATRIITRLIEEELNTQTYPARIAGLGFDVYRTLSGISLVAKGYSETVPKLASLVANAAADPQVDARAFELIQADMIRELKDQALDAPYEQLMQALPVALIDGYWSTADQLAAAEAITLTDVEMVWRRLLAESRVDVMTHGNLTDQQARVIADDLVQILRPASDAPAYDLPGVNQRFADGDRLASTIDHNDNAWLAYLPATDESSQSEALYRVLGQVIKTPFYTRLRTEQQLGYIVFAGYMPLISQPGLVFVVQSPETTPNDIELAAEAFWAEFSERTETMTMADFERFKAAVLTGLTEEDPNLSARSQRLWNTIGLQDAEFQRRGQVIQAVSDLRLESLRGLMQRLASGEGRLTITTVDDAVAAKSAQAR